MNVNAGVRLGLVRVTHVDSGHSVRGSWGDTRALHLTMEDDVRIKMNMVNVNDYLNLQAEAGDSTLLIKKVGRVFSGPTESMAKMQDLMSGTVHKLCNVFNQNLITRCSKTFFHSILYCVSDHFLSQWRECLPC